MPTRRTMLERLVRTGTGLASAAWAAACGAAGQPGGGPPPGAQRRLQGRIELWRSGQSTTVEGFIRDFGASHAGVEVTHTPARGWVDLFEKLYAAIAADTGPEAVHVKEYNTVDLGHNKALQSLDGYIKADKSFKAAAFSPGPYKMANFDGAQYGLPVFVGIHVVLWSKPLFQQAGLAPDVAPQRWTEFRDAARRIARPDQDTWGFKLFDYGTREAVLVWLLRFVWTNGGRLFDSDATKVVINSEAGVEALQLFTDMLHKDRSAVPPDLHGSVLPRNGRLGLWETGAYGMVDMDRNAPQIPYGVAELPWAKQRLALLYQDNLVMTRTGKNKEAGWELVKYMTEPEQDHRWSVEDGHLPSRMDNFKRAPFDGSDPKWKVHVDAANNSASRGKPLVIRWEDFCLAITSELDAAFKNQKSPKAALDAAAQQATRFIQENNSTRLTKHLLKDK